MDGRNCIYVKFEGNQTPYFASGVARIRVADEDLVMSPQELAEYIRNGDREENRWENLISNKTIDDVDEELLKKYTNQAHDVGRIAIKYTDKKTVLNQLELSEGNNLINAGKALFADDLIQDIQMAIFATNERLTFNDIQRQHGPVLKLVDIAESYIKSNIHWRVEFTGSLQRTEIPEIPLDAIREALLIHFAIKIMQLDKVTRLQSIKTE
jgi:ATP-dependent DNA helicase RecG